MKSMKMATFKHDNSNRTEKDNCKQQQHDSNHTWHDMLTNNIYYSLLFLPFLVSRHYSACSQTAPLHTLGRQLQCTHTHTHTLQIHCRAAPTMPPGLFISSYAYLKLYQLCVVMTLWCCWKSLLSACTAHCCLFTLPRKSSMPCLCLLLLTLWVLFAGIQTRVLLLLSIPDILTWIVVTRTRCTRAPRARAA